MASTICRLCHRPLSNLVSMQRGYGDICWGKVGTQTSIMPEDPDFVLLPFENDVILRREEGKKYMNIPQTIIKHSPTGMEWGYAGSGPADLALNILFFFTKNQKFAEEYHQDFKFKFVAGLNRDEAVIKGDDILDYINQRMIKKASVTEEPRPLDIGSV